MLDVAAHRASKHVIETAFEQSAPNLFTEHWPMCHKYVLKCVDIGLSDLWPIVCPEFLGLLEQYGPDSLRAKGTLVLLESKFGRVISDILEHPHCSQVVVDVLSIVRGVLVDCVEDRCEVLLAEFVDVVIDYQF